MGGNYLNCSLVDEFDGGLEGRQRDRPQVTTRLPELDVLRAELFLAEPLKVVAARDVTDQVGEGAGPASQLPVIRGGRTGREGREG